MQPYPPPPAPFTSACSASHSRLVISVAIYRKGDVGDQLAHAGTLEYSRAMLRQDSATNTGGGAWRHEIMSIFSRLVSCSSCTAISRGRAGSSLGGRSVPVSLLELLLPAQLLRTHHGGRLASRRRRLGGAPLSLAPPAPRRPLPVRAPRSALAPLGVAVQLEAEGTLIGCRAGRVVFAHRLGCFPLSLHYLSARLGRDLGSGGECDDSKG